jgi:uncharacterized membrane-anchored protein
MGLPFPQAIGALALITVAGGDDPEIRELADGARATLQRLGAEPFLRLLEAALASASDRERAARRAPSGQVPDTSVTIT